MGEHLTLRGTLAGHGGWVTAIATTPENPDIVLSASRDKVSLVFFAIQYISKSCVSLTDHHRVAHHP